MMYVVETRTGRIRCALAGLILGIALTLAAVYYADGPLYTPSEIDGILAERLGGP